jgi:hypothetical protein
LGVFCVQVVRTLSREPVHLQEHFTQYYPRHPEMHRLVMALRDYGLYRSEDDTHHSVGVVVLICLFNFRDEHQDFKEEMIRLRTLRGKPPWNPKEKAAKKKK